MTEEDVTTAVYRNSLEMLRSKIRSATSSLTSVPKPLKFLRAHFDTLKEIFEAITGKNWL